MLDERGNSEGRWREENRLAEKPYPEVSGVARIDCLADVTWHCQRWHGPPGIGIKLGARMEAVVVLEPKLFLQAVL